MLFESEQFLHFNWFCKPWLKAPGVALRSWDLISLVGMVGFVAARTTRLDGKEFFRQARSRLSYEQFSLFLANIKELNAHRQTREVSTLILSLLSSVLCSLQTTVRGVCYDAYAFLNDSGRHSELKTGGLRKITNCLQDSLNNRRILSPRKFVVI